MLLQMKPEAEKYLRSRLAELPGVSVEERTPGGELVLVGVSAHRDGDGIYLRETLAPSGSFDGH